MAQVTVTIDDKQYRMACDEGQEEHLIDLAQRFDRYVGHLKDSFGEIGDQRLTVMAGIMVMDELSDEQVVQALEVASSITQLVNRVHVSASGVIARRSTRAQGHSGLAQTNGHRGALSLVQHVTGASRREAAQQIRVGESLFPRLDS